MWYKYIEETQEWLCGNEIHFPDGTMLKDNHEEIKDGWKWYDESPIEIIV